MNFFNNIVVCKTGQYLGCIIFSATRVPGKGSYLISKVARSIIYRALIIPKPII